MFEEFEQALHQCGGFIGAPPEHIANLKPLRKLPIFDRLRIAAERYIIARDFNEFDPQRADMLWKLQNGGAM